MMNSGSYFIFFASFFIINPILYLINKIAVRHAYHPTFRKIGMKVYSDSYWDNIKYSSLKLYMESYFDLTMCAFLGSLAFNADQSEGRGIGEFMDNYSDIINSLVTMVYIGMGIVFVLVGFIRLYRNRHDLQSKQFNHSMRVYLEGVRNSSLSKMMYNLVFLSRRLITGLVLVMLSPYPYFQSYTLVVLSFLNLLYLIDVKPLKKGNGYEIFNEVFIYICSMIMANMLDASINTSLNELRGWLMIGMSTSNLVINMVLTILSSLSDIYYSQRDAYFKRKAKKEIKNRLKQLKS